MKRTKFIIGVLAIVGAALAIFFVLRSENALVTNPKGIIARSELKLIHTQILLMLSVVVPTIVLLLVTAWKYRAENAKAKHDPGHSPRVFSQLILWIIPSLVIAVMAVVTWRATHALDPYKPLKSDVKPLTIQVVALNWKWLFIYPEQDIASVNFVQFPERTPIHFKLAADSSPMNSFWIPQLSGQIYSMTGMVTQLHLMADAPGEYTGRAAEINGEGFADMTFAVKSTTPSEFDDWIAHVKKTSPPLADLIYSELVKPSINHPIVLYSSVEKDLFDKIVIKYMSPTPTK